MIIYMISVLCKTFSADKVHYIDFHGNKSIYVWKLSCMHEQYMFKILYIVMISLNNVGRFVVKQWS